MNTYTVACEFRAGVWTATVHVPGLTGWRPHPGHPGEKVVEKWLAVKLAHEWAGKNLPGYTYEKVWWGDAD